MAEHITRTPSQRERDREELAFYEGHDADLPTNEDLEPPLKAKVSVDAEKGSDLEVGLPKSSSTSQTAVEVVEDPLADPNIVFWDGPDDPANPMNWSSRVKWSNIAVVSAITFITYILISNFITQLTAPL